MSRRTSQFQRLDQLEKDFHSELSDAAVRASEDSNSQFFLSEEYNPWAELRGRTDARTDRLVLDAHKILVLRSELSQSGECLAEVFLDYCKNFVDISNENRRGVKKHALALLQEIYLETRGKIEEIERRARDGT